jgi:CDP-glycerol glycerophosphotransferase (TagB/SpsB family)
MVSKVLKYSSFTLFLPVWWIQRLIPRNKRIWIFGAWNGERYSDNSRHFFQYVTKNHPEIKAIWLTRVKTNCEKVRNDGGAVYMVHSLKGIFYSLLAKNVFLSSGKLDVNPLFINGATLFQLFHGSPLKKIGLDDKFSPANSFFHKKIVPVIFPFVNEYNCDYVLSNSVFFSEKMGSAFNIPMVNVLETGFPRSDVFFSEEEDNFNSELRIKYACCKLLYYLPTFRSFHKTQSLFCLNDYDREIIERFLEEENMVLITKGHYVDNNLDAGRSFRESRIIHLSDDKVSDINFMIKDADLLITDYSSVYFDFLLTEKPVIFAAFDLEEYLSSSREMYFRFEDVIAGPVVKNWSELMKCLKNIWTDENYSRLRKEKNYIFNKYHDSKNSERLYDEIITHI